MISIGAFYKVQYPFIIKALDKTGVEGKVPQPNKGHTGQNRRQITSYSAVKN